MTAPRSKARAKPPVWVTATGKRITRIKKARHYLRRVAWAPTTREDRQNALLIAVCNLRLYHQLPSHLAVAMVMEHYNPRCLDAHGRPMPWTAEEVRAKYIRAGEAGMYPTLGVLDQRAQQKVAVAELQKEVKQFIRKRTTQGGSCTPSELRHAFVAYRGGEEVNSTAFGLAVRAATGIRTTTPFGKRVYRGFQILETGSGLSEEPRKMPSAA